ncbi:glyoxalase family protein [Cardiosporidium cionae]|uniref:Glyoxalase family protein n=1 Tax=Cardiosporidium cionae TaxID=476202 RepID=A0ABQ7J5W5_9APIC|nr:glyoxalase family protein [Cardiosporidium cionae]|eukprot:KAF8819345.1 glyoxalase family protein [Cardiosporidium cionae]
MAATRSSNPILSEEHPLAGNRIARVVYEVKDLKAARDFYVKLLGFHVIETKANNGQKRLRLVYPKGSLHLSDATPSNLHHFTSVELLENKNYQTPENAHDFLGLGIHLNTIQFLNTSEIALSQAGGSLFNPVTERRVNPSIYPDENAKDEKKQTNAFLFDADGYGLEFVKESVNDALHRIRFFTTSLKESTFFYEKVLGMKLIRHQSNLAEVSYPWDRLAGMSKYFAYSEKEDEATLLQVAYGYDEDKLIRKSGFHSLVVETKNLQKAADFIQQQQWEVVPVSSEETEPFIQVKDPDGWTIRLIEANY